MKTELGITIQSPAVSESDVDRLCEWLEGREWVRASELCAQLSTDDRYIRACAEASEGRILSGQRGYRLFDRSTPLDEAEHAASWLESQAQKMIRRARSIRVRYHRFARDENPEIVPLPQRVWADHLGGKNDEA